METLPVELLRQIVPDLDAAVELGATCKRLRAALPGDLFILREWINRNKYFRYDIPALDAVRCILLVDGVRLAAIPARVAYLRYVAWTGDEYRRDRSFTAVSTGIIPTQEFRRAKSAGLLVLQDRTVIKYVFGTLEWLTMLAANCACGSTLFVLKGIPPPPESCSTGEVGPTRASLIRVGAAALSLVALALVIAAMRRNV
jgi:hypothetical protein